MTHHITHIRYGFAATALLVIAAGLAIFAAPHKADAAVFTIASSTRFISGNSDYLSRTPGSAGNRKTWTWSGWVKRSDLSADNVLFSAGSGGNSSNLYFSSNKLVFYEYNGGTVWNNTTTALFRDPAAWLHIVVAMDTTQATAANRIKLYVNGTQITALDTASYPTQNSDNAWFNNTNAHYLGVFGDLSGGYLNGYLSDVYFVDGQALAPTYFGASDSNGYWRPKTYTGTYGTNGFHLPLMGTSTAAGIGIDTSGNNNTWTVNNIATTDFVKDSPTNSFATLSFIAPGTNGTTYQSLASGNLVWTATDNSSVRMTNAVESGKFYAEATITAVGNIVIVGVKNATEADSIFAGTGDAGYRNNGNKRLTGAVESAYGSTYTTGDVIGIALDMSVPQVTFYKNNVSQGAISLNSGIPYTFGAGAANPATCTVTWNFGQGGQSGLTYYSAAGGYFKYAPPTGYKALSTNNLPTPPIQKPKNYFDTVLYTGDGSTSNRAITGFSFQPDFAWFKNRGAAANHVLVDDQRSGFPSLFSNSTAAEIDEDEFVSFDSSGFTIKKNALYDRLNSTGYSFVSWAWKESPTSGFDIVTYTGDGTLGRSISHSLSSSPEFIIIKPRSGYTDSWRVWHTSVSPGSGSNNKHLLLENTVALSGESNLVFYGAPTATTFGVGDNQAVNGSSGTYVAYLFDEIDGFSKFGSYTGNGSTDGPFIYTGFKPRFIMVKQAVVASTGSNDWWIWDTARSTFNLGSYNLRASASSAENTSTNLTPDFLSNGFKPRGTDSAFNESGSTYIYAAFAEQPFKLSAAPGFGEVTTTARKIRLWGGIRLLGGIRLW